MENLEKSCDFNIVISRPGKVLEKNIFLFFALKTEKFVGHSNSSSGIIHYHVYTEISQNVWSWKFGLTSWKSHGKVMERSWKGHGKVVEKNEITKVL